MLKLIEICLNLQILSIKQQSATSRTSTDNEPFNTSWAGAFGWDIEFDDDNSMIDDTVMDYDELKRLNKSFEDSDKIDALVDKLNKRYKQERNKKDKQNPLKQRQQIIY